MHILQKLKQKVQQAKQWEQCLLHYKTAHPELAAQFETAISGKLPAGWDKDLPFYTTEDKPVSTTRVPPVML